MKGCLIAGGIVLLALLLIGGCAVGSYNGIVTREATIEAKWSDIRNQYQRRYDLVPQLVETVKGAAGFEQSTITAVTEARASVGKLPLPQTPPDDAGALKAPLQAQDSFYGALQRLLVVAENYPELKATGNFLSLQDQLEGTENRLAGARHDYIEAVRDYNVSIQRFPGNLIAGLFGRKAHAQLELPEAVTERPAVDFGKR